MIFFTRMSIFVMPLNKICVGVVQMPLYELYQWCISWAIPSQILYYIVHREAPYVRFKSSIYCAQRSTHMHILKPLACIYCAQKGTHMHDLKSSCIYSIQLPYEILAHISTLNMSCNLSINFQCLVTCQWPWMLVWKTPPKVEKL